MADDLTPEQKEWLLYILEYLDDFHADQAGAQSCAQKLCSVKDREIDLCMGERPRYPRG